MMEMIYYPEAIHGYWENEAKKRGIIEFDYGDRNIQAKVDTKVFINLIKQLANQ